jgi:hypothetical protein
MGVLETTMVEKVKSGFSKLVETWPIIVALATLIWMTSQFHTEVILQLKTQEDQIKAIQEYLKHQHEKSSADVPYPVSSNQVFHPQDASATTY